MSHIKGLETLIQLRSLDLSFNKIKQVKNVNHLKQLKDIYLLQNKISRIEGLEGMENLRNLELAANRIRVGLLGLLSGTAVDCGKGYREHGNTDGS